MTTSSFPNTSRRSASESATAHRGKGRAPVRVSQPVTAVLVTAPSESRQQFTRTAGRLRRQNGSGGFQRGANHAQQLSVVRRLLEECSRSRVQTALLAARRVTRSEHNDRNARELIVLLQPVEYHESVSSRQTEIENNQLRMLFVRERDCRVAVDGMYRVILIGSQTQFQRLP